MKETNFSTSACRHCGFYKPEGRRGGNCQMLGVTVQSSWKACSFASPPFDPTLKKLEEIIHLETYIKLETKPKAPVSPGKAQVKKSFPATACPQLE